MAEVRLRGVVNYHHKSGKHFLIKVSMGKFSEYYLATMSEVRGFARSNPRPTIGTQVSFTPVPPKREGKQPRAIDIQAEGSIEDHFLFAPELPLEHKGATIPVYKIVGEDSTSRSGFEDYRKVKGMK